MNAYNSTAKTDVNSDEDLVMSNIDLVRRIAHHLIARLPSTVDVDDLMQAGMIGLLEAAGNFDVSRGAAFETYAGIRIRGAMLDDIRKHDWTPRSVHHRYRQVAEAIQAIESEHGRPAESGEIAERVGITVDQYHKILADSASSRLFSLEDTLEQPSMHRMPPKSTTATPEQNLYHEQFRNRLTQQIKRLPEREQLVLSLYYERELNLKEIGKVLDVTESRVCQIHGQALVRLRNAMANL